MITLDIKRRIVQALKTRRRNYPSAAKMSMALGINQAQFSRVMKGDYENVISDANWIHMARKLDVQLGPARNIVTAKTVTFNFITAQLEECQDKQISLMLVDLAGIGKTYAARCYVREHRNAVYIDCSQVKSKQKLV